MDLEESNIFEDMDMDTDTDSKHADGRGADLHDVCDGIETGTDSVTVRESDTNARSDPECDSDTDSSDDDSQTAMYPALDGILNTTPEGDFTDPDANVGVNIEVNSDGDTDTNA
ncbi:hypothetical protein BGZ51_006177 [Haplosporangium sp. Z 767]|nr:hypothetical protein BGZ51_006177 [Haplosporangium sp. Z 767]KAF9189249.1 hypothetical protein BGZ50_000865 [Haplosporangium sp. Z 11]